VKARDGHGSEGSVAVFRTITKDEIVTLTNTGGRSTYQNAGGTRRFGVEAEATAPAGPAWWLHGAVTALDARYTQDFVTCNLSPCPVSKQQLVPAGNHLPGVPWLTLDASADWVPSDAWRAGVEARVMSGVFVDDVNSDEAPAFTVVGVHVDRTWRTGAWRWRPFARIDNLFDRRYAGSVIVNEGNSRFFEPAPTRTFLIGVTASVGG
jgi:iron complex outermembrane receptor protein